MTEQILSSQDVDRFVSAVFVERTVNCASSTNSGLENSSTIIRPWVATPYKRNSIRSTPNDPVSAAHGGKVL